MESLVSDIPAGDGKTANFFYSVIRFTMVIYTVLLLLMTFGYYELVWNNGNLLENINKNTIVTVRLIIDHVTRFST